LNSDLKTILAKEALKVLVIRPDRIGDVVLSTPVLGALRESFPKAKLGFLVQPHVLSLFEKHPWIDELISYETKQARKFKKDLKEKIKGFDIAIFLNSNRELAQMVWSAGVPVRIGVISKPHSYLFFNHGVRQSRSQVAKHEAEYGLELLEVLGVDTEAVTEKGLEGNGNQRISPLVTVSNSTQRMAAFWLKSQGYQEKHNWIAVHPGMGGSALNWPESSYLELIEALSDKGFRVLVTAGPAEKEIIKKVRDQFANTSSVACYLAEAGHGLDFLAALFQKMSLVIAPSTGPLHLAGALKKPVLSFFPPIRVQSPRRWGPFHSADQKSEVLMPVSEEDCGEVFSCKGDSCSFYPCMEKITVAQAFEKINFFV
jgi:heptosyltransferase III